ncbi:MAG: serine hydrolase [Bacteroidota bacterium]
MVRSVITASVLFFGVFVSKSQSFDPVLAGQLQYTIDSIRSANNYEGISAALYYPGMGVWKGVSGISRPGLPVNSDMEFGIASNTKLFTGVLILKLVENGFLELDDSLYEYLPAYPNIDSNITIRQLLNHTSGLADVTAVPGYPDSILNDPNRVYTAAELITWAGTPSFPPGTGWEYCNTNYILAGMIAESVTGQSFGRLLRDSILTPLQLDSTFLDVYDSVLYQVADPWQNGFNNVNIPRTSLNSAAGAAGGMYSTSGEMVQWYHSLMNGQVINANGLQEMTTFVGASRYGIGISEATVSGRTVWQHGGAIWGGYNSSMMYDTSTGIVVCVLINQFPAQAYQISIRLLLAALNTSTAVVSVTADENSPTVYPSPTLDRVHINVSNHDHIRVQLFSTSGVMVKDGLEPDFSMIGLPSGLYFLNLTTNKGAYSYKIIKE